MNLLAQKIWSNDFFKICYHAGGSTEHLPRPKMKRRNEESPPSDTSTSKKRKTRHDGEIMTYLLTCPLTLTPPPPPHLLSPCLRKIKMRGSSKTYKVLHDALCHPLVNRRELGQGLLAISNLLQFIPGNISLILKFNANTVTYKYSAYLLRHHAFWPLYLLCTLSTAPRNWKSVSSFVGHQIKAKENNLMHLYIFILFPGSAKFSKATYLLKGFSVLS